MSTTEEIVEPTYAEQQASAPAKVAPAPVAAKEPPGEKHIAAMVQHLATQWLDGWGAVLKERAVSKDPAAVPRDAWAVNGQTRRKPSNVPGILEVYMDVEKVLHEFESRRPAAIAMREIATFIHRDCVSRETVRIGIEFTDGGIKTMDYRAYLKQPPDPALVKRTVHQIKRVERVNWSRFKAPTSIGPALQLYGLSKERFFEASYQALRDALIESAGLRALATDYIERDIKIQVQ
jgi:hypothetical protein